MLAAYNPSANLMCGLNNRQHQMHTSSPVASYTSSIPPHQLDHPSMDLASSWQDNSGHARYGTSATNGYVNNVPKNMSQSNAFASNSHAANSRNHYYASSERSTVHSFEQQEWSPSISPQSVHPSALPPTTASSTIYPDNTYRHITHHSTPEWNQWSEHHSDMSNLRVGTGTTAMSHWQNGDLRVSSFGPQSLDDLLYTNATNSPAYSVATDLPPIQSTRGYQISPISSPSPSPSASSRHISPQSSVSPPSSRRGSVDASAGGKKCSHCNATSTPLWRREPTTLKPLCNACGLYLQQRHRHRPRELIDADQEDEESEEEDQNYNGPECSHCHTHRTSVWRRSKTGAQLCNACGVYARLRGKDRPLTLKRKKIKPRTKHASSSGVKSP
ncbi:hypothetical protein AGABI2DRAFT_122836 [Agaricus bisporus var. bisporus H97]|uniref:hypothetical protein n=1 Tax=Agaricus bisporus var. bisporus (strain H97 / ATCC MYA-4626 / FGSC 10389) TaxID=936046 RepID=UPI00029F736A|nr:hypothetical protein AGABI2DRAFT_122836 [Agaricus bisporus var. bisporus H97]EKV42628.1 hypothetical protein AGABI2DRAFT_122836 [Agaricus bisporus var. bisporus H97]